MRSKPTIRSTWIVLAIVTCVSQSARAQDSTEPEGDQLLFTGTRLSYSAGRWRYAGEMQVRLKDNYRALDNWYIEGVATNLRLKHWEFVPDVRFTVKPSRYELRPGLGVIVKSTTSSWQFAVQHKYQADIASEGSTGHGVRQILFVNHLVNKKFIPGVAGGWFYRWREDFTGVEFVRLGVTLGYVFDPLHAVNLGYFLGWANAGEQWALSGFTLIQLSLNIRTDWKYVPAKIFDF